MKLWLLTTGQGPDGRPVGIFDDYDKVWEAAKKLPHELRPYIYEPFELNEVAPEDLQ